MTTFTQNHLRESLRFIRTKTSLRPEFGVILGSGLRGFAEDFEDPCSIPVQEIPHYPLSTIPGHQGKIVFGKIDQFPVATFMGRVHYYESGSLENVLYPIIVAKQLGIRVLIITNAAGGVNPVFRPGDLMLITDHINLTFQRIAFDSSRRYHRRDYYDNNLVRLTISAAAKEKISLHKGIYCGLTGPVYETMAEVKMLRTFGADAVGMSTVHEVIFANYLGIHTLGISCITNPASDLYRNRLSHEEVITAAAASSRTLNRLLSSVVIAAGMQLKA